MASWSLHGGGTHRDFASLVGLRDPDAVSARVSALHPQLRLGLTHHSVAHVQGHRITAVPRHHAADAGRRMHQAAALPLADVDLQRPEAALVENKGSYLVVLVVPERKNRNEFQPVQPKKSDFKRQLKYLPSNVIMCGSVKA